MQSRMVTPFYNPYAAIPSLHCGFALAVGIAVFRAAGLWWLRTAGLAWMPVVALATVVTGNRFVADVIAGLALTVLGWSIATSARCAKAIHTAQAFLAEPLPFRRSADRQRRWPNIARPAS